MIDLLTQLPNSEDLTKILLDIKFPTIFIFDIKNFKEINLKYRDECGDEVLKKFAQTLNNFAIKQEMQAFRAGDDEFVLLSQKPFELERVEKLLFEIPESLQDLTFPCKGENVKISYNMGISIDHFNVLEKAKIALKVAKAKEQEFMSYSFFAKNLLEENANNLKETITEAIEKEKITPYFQPIFDENKNIKFYEALTRFDDAQTLQSPMLFFNLANQYGFYKDLLRVIFKKISHFLENTNKTISVNIDKQDLLDEDIFSMLISTFKNKNVVFEIDAREFKKNEFNKYASRLKKNNIKILIDNVQSIEEYDGIDMKNIDFIKIHPSITREVNFHNNIDLIKNLKTLDKKIIATGINSENSYKIAKENNLDYFQGFLLGYPEKEIK